MSDDYANVTHNGTLPGFLYVISESVTVDDIIELPSTDGTHWQIQRDLRVDFVAELPITDPPLLSDEEIECLKKDAPDGQTGFFSR